ncbi:MAG: hypothetical protein A3208_06770 [Candidatus Methanoprimaticola hominis]|nr:MAG: hypothetical protein A3208_06770 [Methanomassiliicoccales archaeon Mx-06]
MFIICKVLACHDGFRDTAVGSVASQHRLLHIQADATQYLAADMFREAAVQIGFLSVHVPVAYRRQRGELEKIAFPFIDHADLLA